MDIFLAKLTQQAMNYAIRSGITITSTYAVRQCGRFLKTVDDQDDFDEIYDLQARLDSKIKIVSPAIDMIELIAARGNTSLESAVSLTKSLRWEIQSLGTRLAKAAAAYESARGQGNRNKHRASHDAEVRSVVKDMKRLLTRIEDAVPLINLAITTSGASLSTTLPATVSPSRMLQASTFLTAGDNNYRANPGRPSQVGPTFTLSLYMLFTGHARPHDERALREMTWKETIHKAQVKLMRVPLTTVQSNTGHDNSELVMNSIEADSLMHFPADHQANEYAYHLVIVEDLDDDRVHTFEDGEPRPRVYEGVTLAGLRELLPIHEISKIFYADTGKILNIGSDGESNNPILLLKRDVSAKPPASKMEESGWEEPWHHDQFEHGRDNFIGEDQQDSYSDRSEEFDGSEDPNEQLHRESSLMPGETKHYTPDTQEADRYCLPPNLDREWFAFEVFQEAEEDDEGNSSSSDSEDTAAVPRNSAYASAQPTPSADDIAADLSHLDLSSRSASASSTPNKQRTRRRPIPKRQPTNDLFGPVRSSLSLLEMLVRLTALQQYEQKSHLSIPDEILNFFLEESSTTGANGEERRQMRYEARTKVGFDPYDESPIKHHGEDYQRGPPIRFRREESAFEGQGESSPLPGRGYQSKSSTPIRGSPRVHDEWLLRDAHNHREKGRSSEIGPARSPGSPLRRRLTRPVDRVKLKDKGMVSPSPLGMKSGVAVESDSSLGTSPASAGSRGSESGKRAGRSQTVESEEVVLEKETKTP